MNRFAKPSQKDARASLLRMALEPLDAWSVRRIALTGLVLGVLVFAAGVHLWRSSDMGGGNAGRAALADAQHRLDRARDAAERLPAMRAQFDKSASQARWTFADALHEITSLAAQSSLRIGLIEPSAQKGDGLETEHPLRFRAEGSFGEIRRFLEALEGLPRLVVPSDVQIRRNGPSLALESTLRVFEELPAVVQAEPPARDTFAIDPFDTKNGAGAGETGAMLLVGTFLGLSRTMALVQTPAGVDSFAPGEMIGDERLGGVHRRSIELARRDGVLRTVSFVEDAS
jgi:Tfp pilus assembly protein PilO